MNSGDAAWMLASSALVLLMTPGLAFFYGGMVRSKAVLNMLMMNFACIGIVTLLWVLFGYSLAFKGTNPLIGNFDAVGLKGTITGIFGSGSDKYPELIFSAFQVIWKRHPQLIVPGVIGPEADGSIFRFFLLLLHFID